MVNLFIVCLPERWTAYNRRVPIGSPMLAIMGAPADHDTQTCRRVRYWILFQFAIVHKRYIVAIPYPGVLYYLIQIWPKTFMVRKYILAGHKKFKKEKEKE